MHFRRLLIANRGEIAIRIIRAAAQSQCTSVAVFAEDDGNSLHTRRADESIALRGLGAASYLDIEQVIAAALEARCDAVHPGYGFLSENAEFARRCEAEGLTWIGPTPKTLELFGDKSRARDLAGACGVPILRGTPGAAKLDEAHRFFDSLGAGASVMVKAIGGGGGRGMRAVTHRDELEGAYLRCRSEAEAAFGHDSVYLEERMVRARHIEIQIFGDGRGGVTHYGERECSLQRRHQKIVEVAPSPGLAPVLRDALVEASLAMARKVTYRSLGTFEFLVDADGGSGTPFAFIEANPRLQVEHTVTEEVMGVDLVRLQIGLAQGLGFEDLGVTPAEPPQPRGYAVQARINLEAMQSDGSVRPTGGTITNFEVPSGPGVRCDTFAYSGYTTSPRYDSLLAKVIAHSPSADFSDALALCGRALAELNIEGVETNTAFLRALLADPTIASGPMLTSTVETNAAAWSATATLQGEGAPSEAQTTRGTEGLAGAQIDSRDPLAVLTHGKSDSVSTPSATAAPPPAKPAIAGPPGCIAAEAPMQGTIVSLEVAVDDEVVAGQSLLVMEAMKMEHLVEAASSGVIREIAVTPGDAVFPGHPLLFIEEGSVARAADTSDVVVDLDHIRPDLQELHERQALGFDAARPEAVARRRKTAQRTARENIEDLCDAESFVEYGALAVAAQRRRRDLDDLIKRTPGDGMVAGVGRVNGELFDESRSRCVLMSYDYTVLAGTQGQQNHRKKDRLFELAEQWQLPVVLLTEGGGGRPGDTDGISLIGLDCLAFNYFAKLSGLVPLVAINSGRCFAGNAALLGCCDVVIATENSNIGMGGPAMIEGGGLGVFTPDEVGPMEVQVPNGVVDIAVADEAEAVTVAKKYLSYFQGPTEQWECADQRLLRSVIPENRLRIYDVRRVIEVMADTDSVLELRRNFGPGMVTSLARLEGRPVGIVANNPTHLAGAIDSDGADKAARFMQLCDAYDIPLVFLCDTPGMMVGPEVERTALVRHCCRLFVTGANLKVPFFTVILRKAYGLGAQAMAGGSFKASFFTVAWPTGEFGGMGLEGAAKLGYRKELEALEDPEERVALYEKLVAKMYEQGKAIATASTFELDDVIDPMATRSHLLRGLRSIPPAEPAARRKKRRPNIDTW